MTLALSAIVRSTRSARFPPLKAFPLSFFVHLSAVRLAEMEEVLAAMPATGSVLEIGAGDGRAGAAVR